MKAQDIVFLLLFLVLLWKHSPRLFAGVGLFFLIVSAPLFAMWVFFTAERLVWYGSLFLLFSVMLHMWTLFHTKDI